MPVWSDDHVLTELAHEVVARHAAVCLVLVVVVVLHGDSRKTKAVRYHAVACRQWLPRKHITRCAMGIGAKHGRRNVVAREWKAITAHRRDEAVERPLRRCAASSVVALRHEWGSPKLRCGRRRRRDQAVGNFGLLGMVVAHVLLVLLSLWLWLRLWRRLLLLVVDAT